MAHNFSLQSVLDYRHSRVEILEVELVRLVHALQNSQTYLDALQDGRRRILDQLIEHQQGELDLFMVSRLRSSLTAVDDRIAQQKARIAELAGQVAAKRSEMVLAKQDEEALVILKEKEQERYLAEQAQQENRLQDDIYIARAFHRSIRPA